MIDGVGVAVFATESTRDLMYASDGVAEELDETQFTLGEGPCLDAFRFDSPELHADMADGEARARWPLFTAQVLGLGAASVYAYPLGGGGAPVGVLGSPGSKKNLPHVDELVPYNAEERAKERALYKKATLPVGSYAVVDGNLVTGQNPGSAKETAKTVADLLL